MKDEDTPFLIYTKDSAFYVTLGDIARALLCSGYALVKIVE